MKIKSISKINLVAIIFVVFSFIFIIYNTYERATSKPITIDSTLLSKVENKTYKKIVLAGGCFWCTEGEFNHVNGVKSAISGYTDVREEYEQGKGPSYQEVSTEKIIARESVQVIYDENIISNARILEIYFRHINPTDSGGQFADRGYSYSPAIYYSDVEQQNEANEIINKINVSKKFAKPVAVEVLPFKNFYPAEEYHQDYKDKNLVRYNLYREASGRNVFIRNNWSDDKFINEIFGDNKKMNTSTTRKEPWKNFTTAMKAEKLNTLTPIQYAVTQKNGTEKSFYNDYHDNTDIGIYVDIVSGEPLFYSKDKYDSGTGWPSFVRPIDDSYITLHVDKGLFSTRTEVRSKIADSHLGHVFPDGPTERGGQRYCMNSASLRFVKIEDMEKEGYGDFIQYVK